MKTLHLMRHAKSSWDQPALADRDRVLNARGRRDAPRMGRALSRRMPAMPAAVSPARRAQLTLEGLCEGWPELAAVAHVTTEALYTFSCGDLIDWIAGQHDQLDALFLIGHNPALTDLINVITSTDALDNLPTAGYVQLSAPVDHWSDLAQGGGSVEQSLFPKQIVDN